MSDARSSDPVIVHGDSYVIRCDELHKLQDRLEQARKLLTDLRVNSKHPLHEQWRQECDAWLT